ncbi:hypothetical protein CDD83_6092 [Cordyceps sp. RAO-2017]|nr:hypothetical protein CDD83_6092 [Cordyceps sp. RAO-2017]
MDFQSRFGNNVARCEWAVGYTFYDKALCASALNAATDERALCLANDTGNLFMLETHHFLALLGEAAVVELLCTDRDATGINGAIWNLIRRDVLCPCNLAWRGFERGLDSCVTMSHGSGPVTIDIMATTVAALLGAVRAEAGTGELAALVDRLQLVSPATFAALEVLRPLDEWDSYDFDLLFGP